MFLVWQIVALTHILYKSANRLNFKHTVFGGVVGGLTTLSAMEKVPVDDNDRPLVSFDIELLLFSVISDLSSLCIQNG